jgi:hypothetical protein
MADVCRKRDAAKQNLLPGMELTSAGLVQSDWSGRGTRNPRTQRAGVSAATAPEAFAQTNFFPEIVQIPSRSTVSWETLPHWGAF